MMDNGREGRGSEKYASVANEIRRRIAAGQLAPGAQLPGRGELEASFQVSKVTLQRAMNLLIEDGFVDATRRKGSFVSSRPPHLSRYALVFQERPGGHESWSRFWMAIANEAARRERENGLSIPIFYGVDGHTDTDDYAKLAREVEQHRLAGLIYVAACPQLPDLSILRDSGVPFVTVKGDAHEGISSVTIDEESFVAKALDALAKSGKKRVAFVCPSEFAERRGEYLMAQSAHRGLKTHPFWIQGIGLEATQSARNCVHLLLHAGQIERPDALVITDDNLVESATKGILDSGARLPEEVEVIAHANFPWISPSVVPARRLGFDVRSILERCLQSIDAQRRGESVPPLVKTPAHFEDETA